MFAKFISRNVIDTVVPRSAIIDGIRYFNITSEEILNKLDFYTVEHEPYPPEVEGKIIVPYYENHTPERNTILMRYEYQDIPVPVEPVHTYKKSYLAQWLFMNSYWDRFTSLVNSSAEIKMFWDTSTEFDSNHPMWPTVLAGIQAGLGMTDEEIRQMLEFAERGSPI